MVAAAAAAAWGQRHSKGGPAAWCGGGSGTIVCGGDVHIVGARSGGSSGGTDACSGSGGTDACGSSGGVGDGGWIPSLTLREQPLKREETPFLFSNDG